MCTRPRNRTATAKSDYWKLVNEGFRWRGEWLDDQEYYEGDVVRYGSNRYVL